MVPIKIDPIENAQNLFEIIRVGQIKCWLEADQYLVKCSSHLQTMAIVTRDNDQVAVDKTDKEEHWGAI